MSETLLEDGRAIADLKVVELREELQKRGLSKTGNKKDLADRLRTYILTGAGDVSDKSTPNSPVKSPVANSLIAQYRATQQQLLKEAHTEEVQQVKPENGDGTAVENGHRAEESPTKTVTVSVEKDKTSEKEATAEAVEEVTKDATPKKDTTPKLEPSPTKESAAEHAQPVAEVSEPESKRSPSPVKAQKEPTPQPEAEKPVTVEPPKADTPDRGISEEPMDDDEKSISGAESDAEETRSRRSKTPSPAKEEIALKSADRNPTELGEELDYEDDAAIAKPKSVEPPRKKIEVYTEGIVYVKDKEPEAPRPKPRLSTAQSTDEERTPEGFLRRVEVSPARSPASTYVYIKGLKRPFTPNQWFTILEKFGSFDRDTDFWIDSIKSQSFVRYATVEEATKARDALHHVLWPEGNGSELLVDFADEEEFIKCKGIIRKTITVDGEEEPASKEKSMSPMELDVPKKRENGNEREESSRKRKREQDIKSAEELFKKTKTMPALYYVPLTDEEAARRTAEKAIGKREEKPGPKRRSPSLRRRSKSPPRKRDRRDSPPPSKKEKSPAVRKTDSPKGSPSVSKSAAKQGSPAPKASPLAKKASPAPRRRSPSPPSRRRSPSPRRRSPARRRSPISPRRR